MKKMFIVIGSLCVLLASTGCHSAGDAAAIAPAGNEARQHDESVDIATVTSVVEQFGQKLQLVSLLAPEEVLIASMREHYADYVTAELLAKFQADPQHAPGRTVSSPWPDQIRVLQVERISEDAFEVLGEIIERTSEGVAGKQQIRLEVINADGRWLIRDVALGAYEAAESEDQIQQPGASADAEQGHEIVYDNDEFGFRFTLPDSWEGYTVVTGKWEGAALEDEGTRPAEEGPMISLRHPEWTADEPRQDIPIMVFSIAQWEALQQEQFHIGAAPVNPKELGRNERFVFALPARYNFAFPLGYEEVEEILGNEPLQPTEPN